MAAPNHSHTLRVVIAFVVIVAIGLGITNYVLVLHVERNTDRVDRNTQRVDDFTHTLARHSMHDEQLLRDAAYRLCNRSMQERAAIIQHVTAQDGDHLLRYLPIYDCTPNLAGRAAVVLPLAKQKAYIRGFDHHSALPPTPAP